MPDTPGDKPPSAARDRFEQLHASLRARICGLDYAPGEKLSETALAEEFGISRTPLRRVLGRLEDEGLVRSVHGVGTFVTEVDIGELAQVYRLRMELAELIVSLDPVPPGAAFIAGFRALYARAGALRAAPTSRGFTELNSDVFLTLLQLTANAPLREVSERLYFRTARIWLTALLAAQIDLEQETTLFEREIEDILTAIELGDMDAVGRLRRAHISMSFKRLERAQRAGETRAKTP